MDELVRGLTGEPPELDMAFLDEPQEPAPVAELSPPRRRSALWLGVGSAIAAAAAALLVLLPSPDEDGGPGLRARGADAGAPIAVELRPVQQTTDGAVRLERGAPVSVGDRVWFRVRADQPADVQLWADVDGARAPIGTVQARPTVGDALGPDGGALGWQFDAPGTVTLFASTAGAGACPPDACDRWEVEVR